MKKNVSPTSTKKPPTPSESHEVIEAWMEGVMPALNLIVTRLDRLIGETISGLQYAVKWKKAYYGLPEQGWIIEMVAYDVSVNVVFLGGAEYSDPPPLGEGSGRYVKIKSLDEVNDASLRAWIEEAATTPGWRS